MSRILIIDDNSYVRGTYRRMLEHAGYEIIVATNGEEGIRAFKEKPPDLVITDIFMPEKEGIETIAELRCDFPDVKIIAISGGGIKMGNYLKMAEIAGARCTLTKPIESEKLLEAVQECLT